MQRQGWRFGNICRASALFYRMKTSFPYDKKRSARIALRRKGIVSLMRPAAGLRILRSKILFYRMKTSFPYDKKRSARIALRRKGIVSLMRPAAGLRILRSKILFYRMKTSFPYDKKRSARIALGGKADGCRSNRDSARECAKAHSFLPYRFFTFPTNAPLTKGRNDV